MSPFVGGGFDATMLHTGLDMLLADCRS